MSTLQARIAGSVVLACLIAVSSAAARSGEGDPQPFAVTSTLDGKNVLPHRIRWLGRPKLTAPRVSVGGVFDRRQGALDRAEPAVRLR